MIWLLTVLPAGVAAISVVSTLSVQRGWRIHTERRLERAHLEQARRQADHDLYGIAQQAFSSMLEVARDAGWNGSRST